MYKNLSFNFTRFSFRLILQSVIDPIGLKIFNRLKLPFKFICILLFQYFLIAHLSAQVSCSSIVFSTQKTTECCYTLKVDNTSDACFYEFTILDPNGLFTSFTGSTGWTVSKITDQEYKIRPTFGARAPLGSLTLGQFCISGQLNQNVVIQYNNLCLMIGCETELSLTACPTKNIIKGIKYLDIGCKGIPYKDQPIIKDWPINLLDATGNVIDNTLTDVNGEYGFFNILPGSYTVKEGILNGWQFSFPKSGTHKVDIKGNEEIKIENFGNCPTTCNCDSIAVYLTQEELINSDTGYFYLSISNVESFCYEFIEVQIDSGQLLGWELLIPGWSVSLQNKNLLRLIPPGSVIPEGGFIPLRISLAAAKHWYETSARVYWSEGSKSVECKNIQKFPFPIIPIEKSCCPSNTQPGPELVVNGSFSSGCSGFNSAGYIPCTLVNSPGTMNVTDGNNITAHNNYFSCLAKSGNPTDKFLIVDAALPGSTAFYPWGQFVNVSANEVYTFCAYIKNIVLSQSSIANPTVQLVIVDISNVIVASSNQITLFESQPWQKISLHWTSPGSGSYFFQIRAVSPVKNGCDFGVDCISIRKCSFAPTKCSCPGASNSSNNLVINGDFSSGDVGFTSGLNSDGGLLNNCSPGWYGIHNNLNQFCNGWPAFPGANSPPFMLCIDGSNNGSTKTDLWRSNFINLTPFSNYCFSFNWIPAYDATGINAQNIPYEIMIVSSSGVDVASITPSGGSVLSGNRGTWYPINFTLSSALLNGSYRVIIRQLTGSAYRDFGIDDICFIKLPPPCNSSFTYTQDSCGLYTFQGIVSGTSPYSYSWNFGDPSSFGNNISSLPVPTHQYYGSGPYTVVLTVTDATGCFSTFSSTINQVFHSLNCCDTCEHNLIKNPGFFQGAIGGDLGSPGVSNFWQTASQSPQVAIGDGHCDPVSMQMWGQSNAGESICQPFVFMPGHTYSIKFCARLVSNLSTYPNIQFGFMATSGCVNPFNNSATLNIGNSGTLTNTNWQQISLPPWTAPSAASNYNTLNIRAFSNSLSETPFGRIDNICIEDITKDSCVCGKYEFLYGVNKIGPLLIKNCGDTLYVPSSNTNSLLNFSSSFSCLSLNCPATIDWNLTGPPPFIPVSGIQVAPGSIALANSSFPYAGIYTLTVTGYCNGKPCPPCTIYFNAEGHNCCKDYNDFSMAFMNSVSISTNSSNCKATINIGNLPKCDSVTKINWGDNTFDNGPYGAGSMPMHTYTGSGTYFISYLAIEYDNSVMPSLICFEKFFYDTIVLRCEPLSINTQNGKDQISIYPNPSNGVFTIEMQQAAKSGMQFRITDISGKSVYEANAVWGKSIHQLDANFLTSGLYFLQVISNGKVLAVKKLIKQ